MYWKNNEYIRKYNNNFIINKFNQKINWTNYLNYLNYLNHLTHLTFGWKFNQQVNLPFNLKYLNCDNQYIVDNLPNGIETLEFNFIKNLKLNNLPTGIKKILFYDCYLNNELNCLPKSIQYIKLNKLYNKKISNIPIELKTIECDKGYKFINDFIGKYNVIEY
jgi:hypothetical protein